MTDEPGNGKHRKWRCSLCNKLCEGFGHNPEPLDSFENRCCDECNETQVIPMRIANIRQKGHR